jgi:hypothetical protein
MIRANTCPHCGAPYGIEFAGCKNNCAEMQTQQCLIRDAIVDDITEDKELTWRITTRAVSAARNDDAPSPRAEERKTRDC